MSGALQAMGKGTLGSGVSPCVLLTPSLCSCRVVAQSVMEAYFVYSNGTALDVNQLSMCVPGQGPCMGTAAHLDIHSYLLFPWQAHTV